MIRLFGQPRHEGDGFFPTRAYLLIGILTLAPGRSLSRASIATSLWEQSSSNHALSNLRYVLSHLRKWETVNGIKVVEITASQVTLCGESVSDVDRLLQMTSVTNASDMNELMDLWSGEFLEGEDLPGGDLDIMLRAARHRMTRRFIDLSLDAVVNIGGRQVESLMHRVLEVAPFDEEVIRANLLHLVSMGRIEDATSFYHDFCHRLQVEMHAEVEVETRTLACQLLPRINQSKPRQPQPSPSFEHAIATEAEGTGTAWGTAGAGLPRLLILPPTVSARGAAPAAYTLVRWSRI